MSANPSNIAHASLGRKSRQAQEDSPFVRWPLTFAALVVLAWLIVIPVFNEADNLPTLYERVTKTMEGIGRSYELILVDDGSRDATEKILRDLWSKDGRIRKIRFLRNFGQHPAVIAGFERARGDFIVTLDADLQNPPEEIPKLLEVLWADPTIEVAAGTTVRALFDEKIGGKPADFLIRVNRQPASADQILQENDRVSITPTKIEGAR